MHSPLAKALAFPECLQSFLQRFVLLHPIPRILTQVADEGLLRSPPRLLLLLARGTLQFQDKAAI